MALIGSIFRGGFRAAGFGARAGMAVGRPTARVGGFLLGHTAQGMAMGAAATVGGLAMGAVGLGYGTYKLGEMGAKVLGMGRAPIHTTRHSIPFTNMTVPSYTLNRASQMALYGGGLGMAGAGGAYDYWQGRRWNMTQALATGSIEVERPDFLGATGSLTLASHYRRRQGMQTQQDTSFGLGNAAMIADDVARLGAHVIL